MTTMTAMVNGQANPFSRRGEDDVVSVNINITLFKSASSENEK